MRQSTNVTSFFCLVCVSEYFFVFRSCTVQITHSTDWRDPMATYKMPCIHCGNLIDGDSHFCEFCGSRSPLGYSCPSCLRSITKGQMRCPGCGRSLTIICPHCGKNTFVDDRCEVCGKTLLVPCANSRCREQQFFQNEKCTACGKKISATLKK